MTCREDYLDALRKVLRPNDATLELRSDAPNLSNLNQYFRYLIERSGIELVSFYEKLPTRGVRVVDDHSADFGFPGKIPIPVMADQLRDFRRLRLNSLARFFLIL